MWVATIVVLAFNEFNAGLISLLFDAKKGLLQQTSLMLANQLVIWDGSHYNYHAFEWYRQSPYPPLTLEVIRPYDELRLYSFDASINDIQFLKGHNIYSRGHKGNLVSLFQFAAGRFFVHSLVQTLRWHFAFWRFEAGLCSGSNFRLERGRYSVGHLGHWHSYLERGSAVRSFQALRIGFSLKESR